jgi:hypothetical protein
MTAGLERLQQHMIDQSFEDREIDIVVRQMVSVSDIPACLGDSTAERRPLGLCD